MAMLLRCFPDGALDDTDEIQAELQKLVTFSNLHLQLIVLSSR